MIFKSLKNMIFWKRSAAARQVDRKHDTLTDNPPIRIYMWIKKKTELHLELRHNIIKTVQGLKRLNYLETLEAG